MRADCHLHPPSSGLVDLLSLAFHSGYNPHESVDLELDSAPMGYSGTRILSHSYPHRTCTVAIHIYLDHLGDGSDGLGRTSSCGYKLMAN